MARRQSISVTLTPEQAAFLAACLKTGRYQSTSEIAQEAVRLLEDQQAIRSAEIERARALILQGTEQLESGETLTAGEFFGEWDEELDAIEAPPRPAAG